MLDNVIVLDLGRKQDYTPVGVINTIKTQSDIHKVKYEHRLIHLELLKNFTWDYFYQYLKKLTDNSVLRKAPIIVDANGIGDVVISNLRSMGFNVIPVLTTSGNFAENVSEDGSYHVSKRILVTTLGNSFEQGKWIFAKNIQHKDKIKEQFEGFQMKVTNAGNETFENAKDSIHDDIVTMCMIGNYILRKFHLDVFRKVNSGFKKKRTYNALQYKGAFR